MCIYTTMGETNKQVRVDNWGVFFLQRLQLFFNRTDYCDLTLQFEGNVQLKVHRLVMNACTEYFNTLEQTCEVVDGNTIIMPDDLQADVILPIVNFMYTGMLEFQMSIFEKLYRTADIMNIPILTKLLDAQKKPIAPVPRLQNRRSQPTWNVPEKKKQSKVENDLPATLPGRKLPVWKRKSIPTPQPVPPTTQQFTEPRKPPQDPLALFDNTPKPTRFEWPEDEINSTFNLMENSFDDISYTSKPLLTQDDELRASTSFETETKYVPNVNKKSKEYGESIDIDEMKNYIKEQKIRSDMVEYEDEDDPDTYLENLREEKDNKRKGGKLVQTNTPKRLKISVSEKENKEAKINVSGMKTSDMDHTKIISEVLKKYPHLVKKNKNIRLKILAKSPVKQEPTKSQNQNIKMSTSKVKVPVASPKGSPKIGKVSTGELTKSVDEGPWVCMKCSSKDEQIEFVLYYLYRKHMTDVHNEKFDSRMCKFCGHQSNKHNMLMYHQYTRHGIKPPPAYNFPKCNRCPYIALTENLLIKHKLNHTKFDLQCMECKVAFNNQNSLSMHMQITGHTGKSGRHNYDCQYCTKRYHSGSNLFSHIKMMHRDEARRDGIVSIDEKDEIEDEQLEEEEYIIPSQDGDQHEKIKILSDIKVPTNNANTSNNVSADPASGNTQNSIGQGSNVTSRAQQVIARERVATSTGSMENVASGLATSLGLVDIVVLDENQQYILHNDQQLVTQQTLTNDQREYIIPDMSDQHTYAQAQNINEVITSEHNVITQSILNNSDIASTDELVMVLTDHDYNDGNSEILSTENSNIVVLYSHPVDGQQNQFITSQGNLMLNSQTGILEIRNDAQGMENSQDAQIESIEMIQREINSHNIMNESTHDENVPASADSSFGESLARNQVILENEFNPGAPELMQEKQDEAVQETTVETTNSDDIDVDRMISLRGKRVAEVPEHILVLNDCLETSPQAEPMEIDEECSIQENENQDQNIVTEETVLPPDQHNTTPAEQPEQASAKSMPEIDVITEDVVTSESQTDPNDTATIEVDQEARVDVPVPVESNVEYTAGDSESVVCNEGEGIEKEETIANKMNTNTTDMNSEEQNTEPAEIVGPTGVAAADSEAQNIPEVEPCEESEKIEETVEDTTTISKDAPSEQNVVEGEVVESQIEEASTTVEMQIDENAEKEPELPDDGTKVDTAVDVESCDAENLQEVEITQQPEEVTHVNEESHQSEAIINDEDQMCDETIGTIDETHLLRKEETGTLEAEEHTQEILNENIEEVVQHVEEEIVESVESEETVTENMDVSEEVRVEEQEEQATQIDKNSAEIQSETEENQSQVVEEFVQTQQEETTHSQPEEMQSSPMEINLQTEEVSSQMDDENSVLNESADEKFQEEISQSGEKITLEEEQVLEEESVMTSGDENSQSQDSQYSSSRQEEATMTSNLKKASSQETKISILNDWDDTEDSQQSDNVSKKAEMTVNKLIHDWDDDEEEGHESDN